MADSKNIDDGGFAFPATASTYGLNGMTMRQWFATHAPEPSPEDVRFEMDRDVSRNPHNDYHKPARRGRLQIIADLKFAYADAMIAASRGGRS
jgi:hypothetical protein